MYAVISSILSRDAKGSRYTHKGKDSAFSENEDFAVDHFIRSHAITRDARFILFDKYFLKICHILYSIYIRNGKGCNLSRRKYTVA